MDKYDVFQTVKNANESEVMKDFKSRVRFDVNVSSQTGEAMKYGAINNYHAKSGSFKKSKDQSNENFKYVTFNC